MKKLLLAVSLVATSWMMTSCNSGGGDPKATLISFFEALGKKDVEGARKLATKDSKSMLDMMEMGLKMSKDSKDMDKFDKAKMEFGEPKIAGDKATIAVKEKATGENTNFTLKKEDGTWKVAFDKASMMEMGMEKMKEHPEKMDDMKDMNMDSLKENMKDASAQLDSAKKMLEELQKNK